MTVSASAPQPGWQGHSPELLFAALKPQPVIKDTVLALCKALAASMRPRLLELVALRTAAVLDSPYVWSGHVFIAAGGVLRRSEIAAAAVGAVAFADRSATVLRAVDELLADHRLATVTRALLGADALGVTVATGAYGLLAGVMAGVGPEPGIPRIAGLESPAAARDTWRLFCSTDGFLEAA